MNYVPPCRRTAVPPRGGAVPRALLVSLCLLLGGRAASAQQDTSGVAEGLPPAGYGTLKQDDVALLVETPIFQIRILPLDERVIRLLATDTYQSMSRLKESKREEVQAIVRRHGLRSPALFLVTFFGLQDRSRFDPEILFITAQNRFFRPVEILPITPIWSRRQLDRRETAGAVFVFGDGIPILDPFTVSYAGIESRAWEVIIRVLDRERAAVLARAARGN